MYKSNKPYKAEPAKMSEKDVSAYINRAFRHHAKQEIREVGYAIKETAVNAYERMIEFFRSAVQPSRLEFKTIGDLNGTESLVQRMHDGWDVGYEVDLPPPKFK